MHVNAYRHVVWYARVCLSAYVVVSGEAPIHTSWFGGSAYANASWQPVNGLFSFRGSPTSPSQKKLLSAVLVSLSDDVVNYYY